MADTGHIILTGFMGTGKTSVGQRLATTLKRPFYDLDNEIMTMTGHDIRTIFAEHGEQRFREIEGEVLQSLLSSAVPAVIATGGGTIIDPNNYTRMERAGTVICLDASFDAIWKRLSQTDETVRPLFTLDDPLQCYALWKRRRAAYAAIGIHVGTDDQTAEQVAEVIKATQCRDSMGHCSVLA
jgi:shikimate kinase